MSPSFRCAAALFAITAGCAQPPGTGEPLSPEIQESLAYLPMNVGNRWTYAAGEGPEVTFEIVGTETVNSLPCFKAVRRIGEEAIPFYVSMSSRGLEIHRVGPDDFDPPFLEFAFPITLPEADDRVWSGKIGDRPYTIRTRNCGTETVTLPLGVRSAIHVSERMEQVSPKSTDEVIVVENSMSTHFWIVKGIGVVKLRGKERDPHNPTGREFEWTLKSHRLVPP